MARGDYNRISKEIEEKIIDLYIIEECGSITIAKKLKLSKPTILKTLKKYNISRRSISEAGKKLFEKGYQHPMLGKHHSINTKQKMQGKRPNMVPWNKGLTKKDNPNIKGGRISKGPFIGKDGYMYIWNEGKLKRYHRYLWEQIYGKISKGYDLHHVDGDKLNNNLQNLELLSKSEHTKRHWQEKKTNLKRCRN